MLPGQSRGESAALSPVDPGWRGGAGRGPGGVGASSGLGSSLLTARASASPPLETENVCLPCFSVFHLCLFIPLSRTFPQLSVHRFLLCFVILPHSLTSLLPLPGGSPCPQPRVPCPPPAAPFCFTLRPPPPPRGSFFRTSLPGPLRSLLPWGRVLSSGSSPSHSRLSEMHEQTIQDKGRLEDWSRGCASPGQGSGRLMPGCGWWGPGAWGHQEPHELCGPPADSVNTKCQVLCPKQFIPSQEESCPSLLAWGDENLPDESSESWGEGGSGDVDRWPWKSKTPSLNPPLSTPGSGCSRSSGPALPCPPGLSPAGTCFIAMSSFPSLYWCWGWGRGAGHLGEGWLCPACPRLPPGPAGHREHRGEHFRILTQVEEVCPAPWRR